MNRREIFEQRSRLLNGHGQHVRNGAPLVMDRQCLPVKSLAFADGASDKQVGQEFHFQPLDALTLAFLAPAAGYIEAETASLEAELPGLFGGGKDLADFVEGAGVRR